MTTACGYYELQAACRPEIDVRCPRPRPATDPCEPVSFDGGGTRQGGGTGVAIYELDGHVPAIPATAFVAPQATLVGKVRLGERASVWFGAVLRGDNELISIGDGSNVQDGAVLHTDPGYPLQIGAGVTVGHQSMLHGCTIGAGSLIGIQAVLLNGVVIGRQCIVAACALVTEGKAFPDRSLIMGAPAKLVRELADEDFRLMEYAARAYTSRIAAYRERLRPTR
jgi:carbonic anhydrase/acetyltransferase-like protein (isoleucine patch superfamily)